MFNFGKRHKAPAVAPVTSSRMLEGEAELDRLWQSYEDVFQDLTAEVVAKAALRRAVIKRGKPKFIPGGVYPLALALAEQSGLFLARDGAPTPRNTAERISGTPILETLHALSAAPEIAVQAVEDTLALVLTKLLWSLSDTSFTPGTGFEINCKTIETLDALPTLADELMGAFQFVSSRHPTLSLFSSFSESVEHNQRIIAGLGFDEDWGQRRKPTIGNNGGGFESQAHAVEAFFKGTPFVDYFESNTPLSIPIEKRKEHMLLMAPSGWGKTQTLQCFIQDDLDAVARGERSIIVIESENHLTQQVARHPYFDPKRPGNMADRLYYLNPEDPASMPTLSFFDIADKPFSAMNDTERERNTNHIVDLYRYIFRALRGNELTEKQGLVFVKLVHMLSWVPGATMETLMECLEDSEKAARLAVHAPKSVRGFFDKRYDMPIYASTRDEIHQRLDTFRTSNGTFERLVSGAQSNLNLLSLMNKGSVVVINTSKNHMAEDGSRVFGRFMIALLRMATLARTEHDTPCMVYIDEAQEFLDEKCRLLFEQARKRGVGLTVSHQEITQLDAGLRNLILGSTAIKLAGQGTQKDCSFLRHEMQTDFKSFTKLRKRDRIGSEFMFYGRDITKGGAVTVPMPFGTFDRVGKAGPLPTPRWKKIAAPAPAPTQNLAKKPTASTSPIKAKPIVPPLWD